MVKGLLYTKQAKYKTLKAWRTQRKKRGGDKNIVGDNLLQGNKQKTWGSKFSHAVLAFPLIKVIRTEDKVYNIFCLISPGPAVKYWIWVLKSQLNKRGSREKLKLGTVNNLHENQSSHLFCVVNHTVAHGNQSCLSTAF
jgi:hypothetical protein